MEIDGSVSGNVALPDDVSAGDCLRTTDDGAMGVVSCNGQHDEEVTGVGVAGTPWPGKTALAQSSFNYCSGFPAWTSALFGGAGANGYMPTSSGWEDGNRDVVCVAFN